MQACIELALIFKCDPYIFLLKDEEEVLRLYVATRQVMASKD